MNNPSPFLRRGHLGRATLLAPLAVAAALAMQPAWSQSATTGNAAEGRTAAAGMDSKADGKISRTDGGMLRDIAQANLAEIASGQVALEKSQNEQVKKFAQMMVDDHTKALGEVRQLAQTKGVKLPDGPDMKHKAVMVEFKALKGDTFDKRYIKQAGVGDHKSTLDLLKKTQSRAKDADVKALATKMTPVVEEHLKHAQQMTTM